MLGAAEAGKSTLLKQMRIIHKADYGLEERIMFKRWRYVCLITVVAMVNIMGGVAQADMASPHVIHAVQPNGTKIEIESVTGMSSSSAQATRHRNRNRNRDREINKRHGNRNRNRNRNQLAQL